MLYRFFLFLLCSVFFLASSDLLRAGSSDYWDPYYSGSTYSSFYFDYGGGSNNFSSSSVAPPTASAMYGTTSDVVNPISGWSKMYERSDAAGSGYFGASRRGVAGGHNGWDVRDETLKNYRKKKFISRRIDSPIDGKVTKLGWPYGHASYPKRIFLRYVEIKGDDGYIYRVMYVKPSVRKGSKVKKGAKIGVSQNLRKVFFLH